MVDAAVPSLDALTTLITGRRLTVLAGAGCSTESGIPDYGGLDANRRRSLVQYRAFVSDPSIRQRYWARSTMGWSKVAGARPNPAHDALAALEREGVVSGVITQNVDGLHHRAGSRRVVELHGSLARVRCLSCGAIEARASLQERMLGLNPAFVNEQVPFAPDGDAEVGDERIRTFRVPECVRCGGMLKPDVVFFGENVPKPRVQDAWSVYEDGEVLLVVGSSLAVFSGFRFVERAARDGRIVVILNVGPTRGDEHAALKIEERVGEVLPALTRVLLDGRASRRPATTS